MFISKVEATGYRCLRDVSQELQPYQILVGANGSGKSVFLDVIAFLGDLASGGLKDAVAKRTENFYNLVWGRKDSSFRLAVEARRPREDNGNSHPSSGLIRYEIEAKIGSKDDRIAISSERLTITEASGNQVPVFTSDGTKFSFVGRLDLNGLFLLKPPQDYSCLAALTNLGIEGTDFRVVSLNNLLSDGGIKTVALDGASLLKPSPPVAGRSAVYKRVHDFLRAFHKWDHALVVFDRHGCGHEEEPRHVLEASVENRLSANGWGNRAKAVVIDPELESWLWDASCQVNRILDWPGGVNDLRRWMVDREFVKEREIEPACPKEAFRVALRHRKMPPSSAQFKALAQNFKFDKCRDAAFEKFVSTLQTWFPAS